MGPADNAGPIFRLRLSGILHCLFMYMSVCVLLSPSSLCVCALLFNFFFDAGAPPNTTGREGLRKGFRLLRLTGGCPARCLGPRREHGNWSDVAVEAEYGGAGEGGMSGEEEAKGRRG